MMIDLAIGRHHSCPNDSSRMVSETLWWQREERQDFLNVWTCQACGQTWCETAETNGTYTGLMRVVLVR